MKKRLLVVLALLMMVGGVPLTSCTDVPLKSVRDAIAAEESTLSSELIVNRADVLWMIDDSTSMEVFQQVLAAQLPELAVAFAELGIDFHFAVVTSDMYRGDRSGRFQGRTQSGSVDCSDVEPPVVIRSNDERYLDAENNFDLERLAEDFKCVGVVGEGGASVERGLDAVRQAMQPNLLADRNDGFLRDDALLIVIFVSDEDDCSHDASALPLSESDGQSCYRENIYNQLTPVEEYVEFFIQLKMDEDVDMDDPDAVLEARRAARSRVLPLGVLGPPSLAGEYGPNLIQQLNVDVPTTCVNDRFELPSGEQILVSGVSAFRYFEFIAAFSDDYERMEDGNYRLLPGGIRPWISICESDYRPLLRNVVALASERLGLNCLPSRPLTCEVDSDCGPDVRCIRQTLPEYAQCAAAFNATTEAFGVCEDFQLRVDIVDRSGGVTELQGFATAQEYCEWSTNPDSGALDPEVTQFVPVFNDGRCPWNIGFSFTSGNEPGIGFRYRLAYPIDISDDF